MSGQHHVLPGAPVFVTFQKDGRVTYNGLIHVNRNGDTLELHGDRGWIGPGHARHSVEPYMERHPLSEIELVEFGLADDTR